MGEMMVLEIDNPVRLPSADALGLNLPDGLSYSAWKEIGQELGAREKVLNWWIGDWWAFGEYRYGERVTLAAQGVFGRGYETLANIASVARKFEPSRRRELSFNHHVEVASLAPSEADALLDKAEHEGLSTRQLRSHVRAAQGLSLPVVNQSSSERDPDAHLCLLVRYDWLLAILTELASHRILTDYEGEVLEQIITRERGLEFAGHSVSYPPEKWTRDEDEVLITLRRRGRTIAHIAVRLGRRSWYAVHHRIRQFEDDGTLPKLSVAWDKRPRVPSWALD